MNYDEREFFDLETVNEKEFDTQDKVEKGIDFVNERLWEKVERVGTKIRFAKEVKALFRYMTSKIVPWYRKSIVIAALIYFISPVDAIPDLAPLIGYLDDLGVIMAVTKFLGKELVPYYD